MVSPNNTLVITTLEDKEILVTKLLLLLLLILSDGSSPSPPQLKISKEKKRINIFGKFKVFMKINDFKISAKYNTFLRFWY